MCVVRGDSPPPLAARHGEPTQEKAEEEEEEEEDPDPEVMARLEIVRKRREAQAKQRITADGWDRMKPMSEDNHPPNMVWPPPDGAAAAGSSS